MDGRGNLSGRLASNKQDALRALTDGAL
jgi:hypothetical protein